jgi:hypothetical protein
VHKKAVADLIYLVEVTAYDPSLPGIRTLRYCSGVGYVTQPSETPANTLYEPRVVQPCNFTRSAFSDARVMGGSTAGYGEIVLNNADQALSPLLDYGMDGRPCLVLVGQQTASYPGGFTVFINGTIQQVEVSASKVTLRLRDNLMLLSIPVQQNLYAGTNTTITGTPSYMGGQEGTTDDIVGQPKPLVYGHVFHVPAVIVNTGQLIYQVHDGAVQGIDAVNDGGSPLTYWRDFADLASLQLPTNQPAPGSFSTCVAQGLFRLGALAQKVTAHIRGDNNGGYVSTVAGIVRRLLTAKGGINPGAIDASFAALDTSFPYECGIYIGPVSASGTTNAPQSTLLQPIIASQVGAGNTVQSAIDATLLSAGAWLVPTRIGTWAIGQLLAPTGAPAAVFTDVDLIDLDSQATADQTAGVPVFRVYLRYKHYPGVLAVNDVNGALSAAARADATNEFRTVNAQDTSVQTTHPLAAQLYRDTMLVGGTAGADAQTEATRVLNLFKVRRDYVRATVRLDETKAVIELGSIIQLQTARLGYSAGRSFVVVGIGSDGRKSELTLDLWG